MIAYLRGKLVAASPEYTLLDVNGVGYRVFSPPSILGKLPELGEEVLLHTHFHVREDIQQLYGFIDTMDLEAFQLLLGVSGIGPKVALAVLGELNFAMLRQAVVQDNLSVLTKIPGVGKKTAQRLILELKDKLAKTAIGDQDSGGADLAAIGRDSFLAASPVEEAAAALEALGYPRHQARSMVEGAVRLLDREAPVEELIRTALKAMATR